MDFKLGMRCRQIKAIEKFNFDFVGTEFTINTITEDTIICKNGYMGFGIEKDEFLNYFELIGEPNKIVEIINGVKIIRNDKVTVVILEDGSKGVSKCLPEDIYDMQKGYEIAYRKAKIKSLTKELKRLCR